MKISIYSALSSRYFLFTAVFCKHFFLKNAD